KAPIPRDNGASRRARGGRVKWRARGGRVQCLAEGVGFEPTEGTGPSTAFKAAAFVHSATPPARNIAYIEKSINGSFPHCAQMVPVNFFCDLLEVSWRDDVVAIEDGSGTMPSDGHGDALRDAGIHHVPNGASSKIMAEHSQDARCSACCLPAVAKIFDALPLEPLAQVTEQIGNSAISSLLSLTAHHSAVHLNFRQKPVQGHS